MSEALPATPAETNELRLLEPIEARIVGCLIEKAAITPEVYPLTVNAIVAVTARQRAVLCVMLLRGPQTLGELLTRTDRLAEFPGLDDVRDTLDRLIQREPALAVRLGRGPGQREDRYMHLLCGPVSAEMFAESGAAGTSAPSPSRGELQERIELLETAVAALRDELAALRARLETQPVAATNEDGIIPSA